MSQAQTFAHFDERGLTQIRGVHADYEALLEAIGDRQFVLIGEASHGTQEFYRERVRITRRLIEEKGFSAVAIEADWPDAYRVNRYVRGESSDVSAVAALSDFQRFPSWMWRNLEVVHFIEWLKLHNEAYEDPISRVGFYGLDLYSLRASIDAVIAYLEVEDPAAAHVARRRYSCFDLFQSEGQHYGHAVSLNITAPCEDEVVAELIDLRNMKAELLASDGAVAQDSFFFAEQNARLVLNAERYYREMYRGNVSSWNLRDTHMVETLQALAEHRSAAEAPAKVVVWAHNSHVGDARFTQMGRRGEFNIGQKMREYAPEETFNIGFTTHHGTVTAASEWGGPVERKRVRPALPGSYERFFHDARPKNFVMVVKEVRDEVIPTNLLERAIGVIYRPDTERTSHWFHADLKSQFDAIVHIDETSALVPIDRTPLWDMGEPPETYPSGL